MAPVRARNIVAVCAASGSGLVTVLRQNDPFAISITFRSCTTAPAIIIELQSNSNEVDTLQDVARVIVGKQQLCRSSSTPIAMSSTNIRAFFGELTAQERETQRQHLRHAMERISNFDADWERMLLHCGMIEIALVDDPIFVRATSSQHVLATEALQMYLEQRGEKKLYVFFDTRGLHGQNTSTNALWTAAKLSKSFHGLSHTIPFSFYLEPAALERSARKIVRNRCRQTDNAKANMSTEEVERIVRNMSLLQQFACRAMDDVFIPVPDWMLDKGFKQDDKNKTWESASAITEMPDGFTYRMMRILALYRE